MGVLGAPVREHEHHVDPVGELADDAGDPGQVVAVERAGARLHAQPQGARCVRGGGGRLADRVEGDDAERRAVAADDDGSGGGGQVRSGAHGAEAAGPGAVAPSAPAPAARSRRCGCWPGTARRSRPAADPAAPREHAPNESPPCRGAPALDSVLSRLPIVRSAAESRSAIGRRAAAGSPTAASRSPTRRPSITSPVTSTVVTARAAPWPESVDGGRVPPARRPGRARRGRATGRSARRLRAVRRTASTRPRGEQHGGHRHGGERRRCRHPIAAQRGAAVTGRSRNFRAPPVVILVRPTCPPTAAGRRACVEDLDGRDGGGAGGGHHDHVGGHGRAGGRAARARPGPRRGAPARRRLQGGRRLVGLLHRGGDRLRAGVHRPGRQRLRRRSTSPATSSRRACRSTTSSSSSSS